MIEWGDALCKCLSRQSRPLFVSIKFGRMELRMLDRNRHASGEEDELGHRRRDSSNPLYAPALKGLRPISRDHRRLPPSQHLTRSHVALKAKESIWPLSSAPETWSAIFVGKISSIQNSSSSFAYVDARAIAVTMGSLVR